MTITNLLPSPAQLLALYESVGWTAYTDDPARLVRAVSASLRVYSAWEDGELIGLVRAVGDGETILYVQDLLVHPDQQDQGVGSALLEALLEDFPEVRQKVLVSDRHIAATDFFQDHGFERASLFKCVCFMRFNEDES